MPLRRNTPLFWKYIKILKKHDNRKLSRDAVQFFFVENTRDRNTFDPMKIVTYRFKRLLFGLNCSPFLLAATIKRHIAKFKDHHPAAFNILDTSAYINDSDNTSEALEISCEIKTIMKRGILT